MVNILFYMTIVKLTDSRLAIPIKNNSEMIPIKNLGRRY